MATKKVKEAQKEVQMEEVQKNSLSNRYDFLILFDCKNGNPNGDPDAANMPRIDVDTNLGIVTDVCLKRKIRNWVALNKDADAGYDIYVNRVRPLTLKQKDALDAKDAAKVSKEDEEQFVIDFMCSRYFDVRTFGAVMARFSKNETKLSGNAGALTGPVQLTFAHSVDPVYPTEITITRQAIEKESDFKDKTTEMGNKWIIPYGLYVAKGYISANLAERTNFSEDDLQVLWDAILGMFDDDHSAARGEMAIRKLVIFKHDGKHGSVPSHKLFDMVKVTRKANVNNPRDFTDYEVTLPTEKDLPTNVELIVME